MAIPIETDGSTSEILSSNARLLARVVAASVCNNVRFHAVVSIPTQCCLFDQR